MKITNKRLDEVTLMRCILALLIVFMHSFTCYNGSWAHPAGYIDIPLYKWLSRLSFAFTLEAFVFISGYLFAFQQFYLKKNITGRLLIISKLKRLILPSVIFSVAYFALFYQYKGLSDFIYNIINGCGHLWFLPMLFWCFIGGWLLEQIKISDEVKLVLLLALNLLDIIVLPLRLSSAFSYLFYFYGGYLIYKYSERITPRMLRRKIIVLWILFLLAFVIFRPLQDLMVVDGSASYLSKVMVILCNHMVKCLYVTIGLVAFYMTVNYYSKRHRIKPFTERLASSCFGVYIFHQFFLQLLYYKTIFPTVLGPYLLPWIGLLIVGFLSYAITVLFMKTRVGKFLIG